MSAIVVLLLCHTVLVLGQGSSQRPVSPLPPPETCQRIDAIAMCVSMPWMNASFPNLREHQTQTEANTEVNGFFPLVRLRCSNAIVHFLCSIYAPFCAPRPQLNAGDSGGTITLQPCRELCMYVRRDCEPIMEANGFTWPPHFNCDNFPTNASTEFDRLCLNIPNVSAISIPAELHVLNPSSTTTCSGTAASTVTTAVQPRGTTRPNPTGTVVATQVTGVPQPTITPQQPAITCLPNQDLTRHTLANSSYRFATVPNCAVPCEGIYFSTVDRNVVAPAFILICALICIGFTLFTVGTFMIDRQRYHYPERPVIFLALCYLVLSLAFVVGAIIKLKDPKASYACSDTSDDNSFVFQRLPNSAPTYHSASCVILFIFIYYFQMAGAIWWVVLTLTWFMASTLMWGKEAVERPWLLYHIFAWCIPAILVILALALRLVDGDQLAGVCFIGNENSVGLGVFVLMPLVTFLILGVLFLVISFTSLLLIHLQISKDPSKYNRLQHLIIRILVYALLYIIPTSVYISLCIYELAEKSQWEESYARCPAGTDVFNQCSRSSSPQFAALINRYLMLFIIGISSTFWVISWKTLLMWQKFLNTNFLLQF